MADRPFTTILPEHRIQNLSLSAARATAKLPQRYQSEEPLWHPEWGWNAGRDWRRNSERSQALIQPPKSPTTHLDDNGKFPPRARAPEDSQSPRNRARSPADEASPPSEATSPIAHRIIKLRSSSEIKSGGISPGPGESETRGCTIISSRSSTIQRARCWKSSGAFNGGFCGALAFVCATLAASDAGNWPRKMNHRGDGRRIKTAFPSLGRTTRWTLRSRSCASLKSCGVAR